MSGKTRLVLHLLRNIHVMNPVPKTILFLYDQYQTEYEEIKQSLKTNGIEMTLREWTSLKLEDLDKKDHQTLVIIDDASEVTASSFDIAKIVTNGRHKNVSLWLVWHSLYSKHPASRLITQNVSYIFLLPSVRLTSQVHVLDSQLRSNGALVSSYKQAIDMQDLPHRYLLLDLAANTPSKLRYRTSITSKAQHVFLSSI